MSLPIWTADELRSKWIKSNGVCWRVVEAQNKVSTLKLVDNLEEQTLLENLIEDTKPSIPPELKNHHYLISTPFRYRPYRGGSRFRRENQEQGVFYASENVDTAIAETAFYKALFFNESPDTSLPQNASEHTAFSVNYASDICVDLSLQPFSKYESYWKNPVNYVPCQAFADQCREAGVEIIKSVSVRCPNKGKNINILHWNAIKDTAPVDLQTWKVSIKEAEIVAIREFPKKSLSFPIKNFFSDPRIKKRKR